MAENQTESSPLESQELPTPEFSDKGDSSTSSGADEIVSKLLAQLEPLIDKKVQSTKDKRISQIEQVLGGRSKILAELESEGVSIPKEVRTQMEIRELREQIAQQPAQPAEVRDTGLSQPKTAVTEAIAKLQQYGLEANDPGFIEILRGRYANRTEFDNKVMSHILTKLAPPKPANVADVTQSPATARTTEKSVEALTEEYKQKMREARGNRPLLSTLRAEYQSKGVKVWEVDFS